jgi:hypothetical protein
MKVYQWRYSLSFMTLAPASRPSRFIPRYPLGRRLGWGQNQSGLCGGKSLTLLGIEPRAPNPSLSGQVKVAVSRPVCHGVRPPSGHVTNFSFPLEIFYRQLWVYFAAPTLTRGRVRNLPLPLGFASTVPLGSESLETQDHVFVIPIF